VEVVEMKLRIDRVILGALAGFSATLPMTFVMAKLHDGLPRSERYPLPPREISQSLPWAGLEPAAAALLYHFLFGAAAGGLYPMLPGRGNPATGMVYGVAVWAASYLGWIPAASVLRAATAHPRGRNMMMVVSHIVWGLSLSVGFRILLRARAANFALATSDDPHFKDREWRVQK
jgi:hypothetical protein